MRISQKKDFEPGYTEIVSREGKYREYLMDFGILRLNEGMEYEDDMPLERVFVLMYGEIEVEYGGKKANARRDTYTDETIWCIDLPMDVPAVIRGKAKDSQVIIVRTENERRFEPAVRCKEQIVEEIRGEGYMNEAGTRFVRTAQDKRLTPQSNLMLGEDMHYPGKWSGFPSHSHVQPEIYFYKFYPENGFGLLRLGDEAVFLEHNDTVLIEPEKVHPQVAAPGYAMYYFWVIRHLDGNPYLGPDFEEQHLWVEQPGAKYWPDR